MQFKFRASIITVSLSVVIEKISNLKSKKKRNVWISSIILGLKKVRDIRFGMGISSEKLPNAAKW